MSLFSSIYIIAVSFLYGEYVGRFPFSWWLSTVPFDHGLDFDISLHVRNKSINQSRVVIANGCLSEKVVSMELPGMMSKVQLQKRLASYACLYLT